jgi:DNA-binding transcriptional LysR family regulator
LRRFPDISLQLIVTDRPTDLLQEDIDLAIRITDQPPQALVARHLLVIEQVLVASPPYLALHGIPGAPQELSRHACIYLGEHANDNRWVLQQDGQSQSVTVCGRYIANNTEMRLAAALDDLGIASLPFFSAEKALADGLLQRVLADWELLTAYRGSAYLLYPSNRYLAPKLRVLIDYLKTELGA